MKRSTFLALLQHAGGSSLKARLLRGGIGSAAIQALNRVLMLALGIVLARLLGAESFGVYAYAFVIMSMLMVVAEGGVPILLMREVATALGGEQWGLLRGAVLRAKQFVLLVSIGVSAAGLLTLWWWTGNLDASVVYTTAIMLIVLPFAAFTRIYAFILRGLHHVVAGQAVEMLLRPFMVLLFVAIAFYLWPDLRSAEYAMGIQLGSMIVVLLVSILLVARFLPAQIGEYKAEFRDREWLRNALPFTLIGGAGLINNQADIIMLGWFRPSADVGIYRVAVQGATLVAFSLQAANAVVAPHFARIYAQNNMEQLQRLATMSARLILLAAVPVALILMFAGDLIVVWVFGHEYESAYLPMGVLAAGQLVNAAFGSVGFLLNMTGHERSSARILWQTGLVNIVLNVLLIPLYGMLGAAISTSVTMVMWNWFIYRKVRSRLNIFPTAFRNI